MWFRNSSRTTERRRRRSSRRCIVLIVLAKDWDWGATGWARAHFLISLLLCIIFDRAAFAYCSGNGTAVVPDNLYFTCTMTSVKGCWKNPTDGVTRSPYGQFVCLGLALAIRHTKCAHNNILFPMQFCIVPFTNGKHRVDFSLGVQENTLTG